MVYLQFLGIEYRGIMGIRPILQTDYHSYHGCTPQKGWTEIIPCYLYPYFNFQIHSSKTEFYY